MGVGEGNIVGVAVADAAGVEVTVEAVVGVGVNVGVTVGVGVGVDVGVGVGVGVDVGAREQLYVSKVQAISQLKVPGPYPILSQVLPFKFSPSQSSHPLSY